MFESLNKCSYDVTDSAGNIIDRIITLDCITVIFQNLILWALIFAGIAALFMIIISGIKFITSGGDPKQVEGARKTLTFAIAGLVLILLSFAILRFIAQTTGVDCIREFGFDNCEYKSTDKETESTQSNQNENNNNDSDSNTSYDELGTEGSSDELNCNPSDSIIRCRENANNCKCVSPGGDENLCYRAREYCGPGRYCKELVNDVEGFLGRCQISR